MKRWILLVFLATSWARAAPDTRESPLVLISLDGFRWDYCDLYPEETPTLRALRREGVSTRGLIPSFPSNTFPNHYTLVTGLRPARHGIVNNDFFDPVLGEFFNANQPAPQRDSRWWGGEPIWVTAIKQGKQAAASFWVGSEAQIGGVRPTFWSPFNYSIPFQKRLDDLIGWLKLPANQRPAFVAFYLEETNGAGHRFGPNSPQVAAAVKLCDERVAAIRAALEQAGVTPNLLIVSDHGMTATNLHRTVIVDELIDLSSVQIESHGSLLALRPLKGDAATLVRAFAAAPHVKAFLAADLPERFHFKDNPRIAPVWVLPDEGWHVETRAAFERLRTRYSELGYLGGDHGYDPALASMRGILIAHGPAFRRAIELPEVENIHLYTLMCAVMKLSPAPNDGDDRLLKTALRE